MNSAPGGALSGTALLAQSSSFQTNSLLSQNFSLFGQDAWKVTPRLTITYGLRWDINPALKGKNRDNDPFTLVGLDNPATITLAPRGTPLYETTYGNLAPRIGVAYQFSGIRDWDAALRAGFGIFYDLGQGSLGGVLSFFPYIVDKNFSLSPFPLNPQDAAPPPLTTNLPAATMLVADRCGSRAQDLNVSRALLPRSRRIFGRCEVVWTQRHGCSSTQRQTFID